MKDEVLRLCILEALPSSFFRHLVAEMKTISVEESLQYFQVIFLIDNF